MLQRKPGGFLTLLAPLGQGALRRCGETLLVPMGQGRYERPRAGFWGFEAVAAGEVFLRARHPDSGARGWRRGR